MAAPKKVAKDFLFFFSDVNLDLRGNVAENFDGHRILTDGFDRFGKLDLALVYLEVLRGERFGDVRGGDGAEHLIVLAGLARETKLHTIDQRGLFLRGVQFGGGFLRQRRANALQGLHVASGGFDRQLLRQQEIPGVAGLYGDDIAPMAELIDVFLKDYFLHRDSLSLL